MHVRTLVKGILLFCIPDLICAHELQGVRPGQPIAYYYSTKACVTNVHLHSQIRATRINSPESTKTATFEVTFTNFPDDVNGIGPKSAFQYAVNIWSTLIVSPVVIKINAKWTPLAEGVLGEAIPFRAIFDFDGAQNLKTLYPIALAEKIAGKNLNALNDADIDATFNSNVNWYYGVDGNTPINKMDFVTVVLHEMAHGLGMTDSYDVNGTTGSFGKEYLGNIYPMVYDLNIVSGDTIESGGNKNLFIDFVSPSTTMKTVLTSNNIFYNSPRVKTTLGGVKTKLYAPSTFSSSSSIAHLDEITFPANSLNSLMTSTINLGESIHDPGPVTLGLLADLGWINLSIKHDKISDTERIDGNVYKVLVNIISDNGISDNKFISKAKLNYTINGVTYLQAPFIPTGNANEFIAAISGVNTKTTFSYYISVVDSLGRTFTNPAKTQSKQQKAFQNLFSFTAGPDTEAPIISHNPVNYVLDNATTVNLSCITVDNIGVKSVVLEYYTGKNVNKVNKIPMSISSNDLYNVTITLPDTLKIGDRIKYRIVATDLASNENKKVSPLSDYYTIYVSGLLPIQDFYINNFDIESFDFFGEGFSITTPTNFSNPAIQTDHPYTNTSVSGGGTYFYQLQVPIRLNMENPTIKFSEVVLVEPGQTNATFGQKEFYDYVIVEGSKDLGNTWAPLINGYDARAQSIWLSQWGSKLSNGNSMAEGKQTLYRQRIINMLNNSIFNVGDEVMIRFRMFTDNARYGWGWAIDNLSIQAPAFDQPMSIYPNPVIDKLMLEANTESASVLQIQIISAQGKSMSVQEFKVNGKVFRQELNVADLLEGLYILKVAVGSKVYSRKFLKK